MVLTWNYYIACCLSASLFLSGCGSFSIIPTKHVKVSCYYHPEELDQLRRVKDSSDDELYEQCYFEGDPAALYFVGLVCKDSRDRGQRPFAKKYFSAAATLGFAPAFLELAECYYKEGNQWANIIFRKMALEMDHDEVVFALIGDRTAFENGVGHSNALPAVKRDVERIKELIQRTKEQLARIEKPEDREGFIYWLVHIGGLTMEGPELSFQPLPGEDVKPESISWTAVDNDMDLRQRHHVNSASDRRGPW